MKKGNCINIKKLNASKLHFKIHCKSVNCINIKNDKNALILNYMILIER